MGMRSVQGQATVESINIALAHHQWIESSVVSPRGTWHLLDDVSRRSLATIASCTAFTEMFMVDVVLRAVLDRVRSFGPGPEESFYPTLSKQVENNFFERVSLLQTWFGIDLRSWERWSEWNGFVEARNAWAHGQGELTRQQRNRGAAAKIEAAGMTVVDNAVRCDANTAKAAAMCAVSLVDLIDDRLVAKNSSDHPGSY
jgi:hypothetical protein